MFWDPCPLGFPGAVAMVGFAQNDNTRPGSLFISACAPKGELGAIGRLGTAAVHVEVELDEVDVRLGMGDVTEEMLDEDSALANMHTTALVELTELDGDVEHCAVSSDASARLDSLVVGGSTGGPGSCGDAEDLHLDLAWAFSDEVVAVRQY